MLNRLEVEEVRGLARVDGVTGVANGKSVRAPEGDIVSSRSHHKRLTQID